MFDQILVPLDGSLESESVLSPCSQLAQACRARVFVLHVHESERGNARRDDGEHYLSSIAARFAGIPFPADALVASGDPAAEILRVSAERHCGLIAMSTHGRSALGRWVFGSVAARVLEKNPVPTLLVRPRAHQASSPPLQRIVVPLDGSRRAEAALTPALTLAGTLKLPLVLLRAVVSASDLEEAGEAPVITKAAAQKAAQRARRYLESRAAGTTATVHCQHGQPPAVILDYAQAFDGTLIVMTTKGAGGAPRWALGRTAQRLIEVSTQPLLVLPTPTGTDTASA